VKSIRKNPKITINNATSCNLETEVVLEENILYLVSLNKDMIIYTPLNIPKIEPDNWEVFWNIWNKHSDIMVKKSINLATSLSKIGESGTWRGLDIYKLGNMSPSWDCPYFDIKNDLPLLFQYIGNLPIKNIYRVRLIQSLKPITPHTDNDLDRWEYRALLHNTSPKSQWFFTEPKKDERTYIELPDSTNWFAYNDKYSWHGSDYDPKFEKILVQLFFLGPKHNDIIPSSIETYKEYTIDF
jgi:hypothetical protein